VRPGDVQKVFVIKHVHVNDLSRVLAIFPAELSGMERDNMRVLSASAAPAVVAAIEETIKRLDVPPPPIKSVEITAYVLECSTAGEAGSLPQDLQGVFVQLKKTFSYSGCGLARTLFARGSDDSRFGAEFNERTAGKYELNGRVEVDSSEPPTVRLRGTELVTWSGSTRSRLSGDIEVRGGQKVVLGRLGVTESGKDQIVVLTAKVAP
jgi:DNA-binding transcriptional regulator YdaS (Cro superfamily)